MNETGNQDISRYTQYDVYRCHLTVVIFETIIILWSSSWVKAPSSFSSTSWNLDSSILILISIFINFYYGITFRARHITVIKSSGFTILIHIMYILGFVIGECTVTFWAFRLLNYIPVFQYLHITLYPGVQQQKSGHCSQGCDPEFPFHHNPVQMEW